MSSIGVLSRPLPQRINTVRSGPGLLAALLEAILTSLKHGADMMNNRGAGLS